MRDYSRGARWRLLAPDYLLGPGCKADSAAGYEGFTGGSWQELMATSPRRLRSCECSSGCTAPTSWLFGLLAVAVAATAFRRGEGWAWWALLVGNTIALVSAMTYDWTVSAIGPFELTEYLGLALIWGALAVTAPFRAADGQFERRGNSQQRLPEKESDRWNRFTLPIWWCSPCGWAW